MSGTQRQRSQKRRSPKRRATIRRRSPRRQSPRRQAQRRQSPRRQAQRRQKSAAWSEFERSLNEVEAIHREYDVHFVRPIGNIKTWLKHADIAITTRGLSLLEVKHLIHILKYNVLPSMYFFMARSRQVSSKKR